MQTIFTPRKIIILALLTLGAWSARWNPWRLGHAVTGAEPAAQAKLPPGEGADLAIGGPGQGKGAFSGVQSIAFDDRNNLYVLDWGWERNINGKNQWTGNSLVQKFNNAGKFLGEFSIASKEIGDKHFPTRLTVDGKGQVYITQPKAGVVQQFDAEGKHLRDIPVPNAFAITVRKRDGKEDVIVVANPMGKNTVEQAAVLDPSGKVGPPLPLGKALKNVQSATTDKQGNLYVLADLNQVYKFDPAGKLLTVLGAGTSTRAEDGSELIHGVAVDSQGNLYAMTWGNPGRVAFFDADQAAVTLREGQFKWADPWSIHSRYTCLAVDRNDRLWVGVTGHHDPKGPNFKHFHVRPAVVRAEPKFFDTTHSGVVRHDTLLLGLRAEVDVPAPYHVAYDLKPVEFQFVVKPGNRRVKQLAVRYRVFDMVRTEIATGQFDLPLKDGVEARQTLSFTPPRYGWYTIACEMTGGGKRLTAVGAHVGVTPRFEKMPVLAAGESPGGWDDAPRLAFCGHMVMRVHPTEQSLEKLKDTIDRADKYGVTVVAQLSDAKECNPEFVRKAVGRYKGRIKYWEIWNEPNFRMNGAKYAALIATLYPIVKEVDPAAKVMGPTVCGINLPWHEDFYKAGGGKFCDILSIHDYEGHESIDPVHWQWKIGALRKVMAAHGDAGKPIWQTERAITAVRGDNFMGGCQAVRVTLQRDLLETLGIPSEHNILYYLNEGGYGSVPSYIWSKAGPHPAALALRTRQAMIQGRPFVGTLDFGPTGNKILWGLHYRGPQGDTVMLRNLGTLDQPVDLQLKGGSEIEVVDSFGNTRAMKADNGKLRLVATQMPQYLRLAKGQEVKPVPLDFGKNIANQATFTYSAESTGKGEYLTNGILEVFHAGNPHGDVDSRKLQIFNGKLPSLPQTLEIAFPEPRTVGKMLIFGLRADNTYCSLLDYDLEYHNGKDWVKLAEVRTPCPPSDPCETPQCKTLGWYLDNNSFVHQFTPVKTGKLRLVVRRTTFGFVPDDRAKAWGKTIENRLMLREIELYE